MATKVSEASITCSICLGRFRNPRILPCLHSYCEDCLVTYAPKGTASMKCPLCKDEIEIPDGDVAMFKLDFRLQGQVEDAASYDKLAVGSGPELECNCCDEGQKANGRCLDCEQFLCEFGIKSHEKIAGLRNHDVYTLEELRSGKVELKSRKVTQRMCTRHPDEKARYYCHTCHDFVCRECTVLDHPKPDHEYTSVADAANRYKEIVSEKLAAIAKVRDDFKESEEVALKKVDDIEKESVAVLSQLRKETTVLRAQIDKIEKERSDEVVRARQERNDKAQDYASEFRSIRERAGHIYETVEKIIGGGSDDEFLSLYSTLDTKMEQLSQENPRSIEMDGAYMMYSRLTSTNIEMGKLEIPEIEEWEVTQRFGEEIAVDGQECISVALQQNGDLFALFRTKEEEEEKPFTVAIFKGSEKLKHSFEIKPSEAVEDHSRSAPPSDLCIMPDGLSTAIFRYNRIDIFQNTGTLVRSISLKGHDFTHEMDAHGKVFNIGTVKIVHFQNEHHFLASFHKNKYIGLYNVSSGELKKRIDVDFNPFRLAVVDNDTFLVTDLGIFNDDDHKVHSVYHMNLDGVLIRVIAIPPESGMSVPVGVCYDSANEQIYVAATDKDTEEFAIFQYSSSGLYLGCISTKVKCPYDINMMGINKIAIADVDDIKILTKT